MGNPLKLATLQIDRAEYQVRNQKLLEYLQRKKLNGIVVFDNYYILYYTGFAFIPTERPIAYLLTNDNRKVLFVPRLEQEHALNNSMIDLVEIYQEYPTKEHPMLILESLLKKLGIHGDYGAEQDGYPWILGYRGPSLSEMTGSKPRKITGFIENQMMIKSPAEVSLIRESVKWGNLAHTLLQRYTRVGESETVVSHRASHEANIALLDAIGPIYRAQSPFSSGVEIGYRGQIGRNSAIPHALANNIIFQKGDVLVTGASAPVWGYNSELERTMIIGPASDAQKRLFSHMCAVQETAFSAMEPGAPCSVVDGAVMAYFEDHELQPYWRHHSGHAIGLRYHEGPFLDIGDQTIMQPGMVFTVEPGLYDSSLGGFRHSDTVLITESDIEILTYYPRDLESLTIQDS
jgi:Xaa-Pro aminopeptidase